MKISLPLLTLRLPLRQCSSSCPAGSSVKTAKPDRWHSRMLMLRLSVATNSSTVVDPSKLITCTDHGRTGQNWSPAPTTAEPVKTDNLHRPRPTRSTDPTVSVTEHQTQWCVRVEGVSSAGCSPGRWCWRGVRGRWAAVSGGRGYGGWRAPPCVRGAPRVGPAAGCAAGRARRTPHTDRCHTWVGGQRCHRCHVNPSVTR